MNKTIVFEAMLDVLNESFEWAFEVENHEYANYISGVTDLTNNLLNKIDNQ